MTGSNSQREAPSGGGPERPLPTPAELVFAMCHEISNAMAAVRLQAHMLDEDLGTRALALASVELDDLAARSSALLALARPILEPPKSPSMPAQGDAILAALSGTLEDHGGRGARLHCGGGAQLPGVLANPEVLHYLLLAQVFCAIEVAGAGGSVRVSAEQEGEELVFAVEDDGAADADAMDWHRQRLRGRSLVCAIADHILRRLGGSFSLERRGELSRAESRLPVAGQPEAG